MLRAALRDHLRAGLDRVYTAAVIQVRVGGNIVYERALGHPNPEASNARTRQDTRFDLASLTKIFTTTAFLSLVEQGRVGLDTPVCAVLPSFSGSRPIRPYEDPLQPGNFITLSSSEEPVDASQVTFRQLLTHTSGLPAWRPLFRMPPEERRAAVLGTFFSYPPGSHILYSDLGFILLGWALEALTGTSLADVIAQQVTQPLNLPSVAFRPVGRSPFDPNIAATEFCTWRGRRIWGEVHDENAFALGGVSGHAGLFGNARDLGLFGQAWLDSVQGRKAAFISPSLAQEAVKAQATEGSTRRGLGWALRSPDPNGYTFPLSPGAFGHSGFTGTSLFIDPDRELVVVALTNRVYFGRDAEPILRWRRVLHDILTREVPAKQSKGKE